MPSCRAWKKQGSSSSSTVLLLENTYPNIEPEEFYNWVKNSKERLNWDPRWVNASILSTDGDTEILSMMTTKPPIPMVSAREFVVKTAYLGQTGDGYLIVGSSTTHAAKPETKDNVRGHFYLISQLIKPNPNGKGTLQIEVRDVDWCGSLPDMITNKINDAMPTKNFQTWVECI